MQVEGQADQVEGQENQSDINEKLAQLEATNKRLLDESRKWKERAQREAEEKAQKENEIFSKEKDVSKRLEMEQKQREKTEREKKELEQKLLMSDVQRKIMRYAGDVNDIEDLLNQPKYAEILKRGIDKETLELDDEVAKEYVETVLKAKPYLRKSNEATTMMTSKPSYKQGKGVDLDSMDGKEIEKLLIDLYGNK